MKHIILGVMLAVSVAVAGEPISWKEIAARGIQGELGLPLGNIVTVEGIVVSGRVLHPTWMDPNLSEAYYLRITKVADKVLAEPLVMRYFSTSRMLPDSLYKIAQMKGEKPSDIYPADIPRVEKDIVGCAFRMLVMEEAVLKGNPLNFSELPDRSDPDRKRYDDPVTFWQSQWGQFGYHHFLHVLEVLEKMDETKPTAEPTRAK